MLDLAISETTVDFSQAELCEESLLWNVSTYLLIVLTYLELDFCYLKLRVLHNTFEYFIDIFVVNMDYSRVQ